MRVSWIKKLLVFVITLALLAGGYSVFSKVYAENCNDNSDSLACQGVVNVQESSPPSTLAQTASSTTQSLREYSNKTMNPGYESGEGEAPETDAQTKYLLKSLGYSEQLLWQSGIKIIPEDGLVAKHCDTGAGKYISGMAVKPNQAYTICPDGQEVVEPEYKTPGKCTVVFDASRASLAPTEPGNSKAVLAHEIGHCLHFIYGQAKGMLNDYTAMRSELITTTDYRTIEEIVADDFMRCRHDVDTHWGDHSYYHTMGVSEPTSSQCVELNDIFDSYFAI